MTAEPRTRTRKQRTRRSVGPTSTTRPLTRVAKKRAEVEQQRVLETTATREITSESATDEQYAANEGHDGEQHGQDGQQSTEGAFGDDGDLRRRNTGD
ncbi:uncharacterized protein IUM83_16370 [Phytophthora cinnamomi]|uniref:uncharacterized protein n=1 Tax=Phytophthora cinnamomi TaxID=4785 RepID=UPI00355A1046|nr:hypothetical protein IUM83_16370 [Phytophthora cinnamomi]